MTVVLTLIAGILTARLKLDLNLFSLLPSNHPSVKAFFEIADEIGFQSLLIAIVNVPRTYDSTKAESFVDLFAEHIGQSNLVNRVEYKTGMEQPSVLLKKFLEYFPLFLKTGDLEKLRQKLSDAGIQRQVFENKKLLMTPFGIAGKSWVYEDPLGLRELLSSTISGFSEIQQVRAKKGYYRTQAEDTYFLFVKPIKLPQDIAFSKKLMASMHRIEKISIKKWSDSFGDFSPNIKISYTGGHPIAVNDETTTKRDIKTTLLTSFLGVMILFGFSFRTTKILLYVGAPLVISILWTLGFAGLIFHRLNLLTYIFSCVLIGLGIDFAIHIVNRYFEYDKRELGASQRLQMTFREAGMGIVIGGISTAAAFYAIAISDFRGFKELGILTGTGILICLTVMIFVLPSLLFFYWDKKDSKNKIAITGFGLKPLMEVIWKYPWSIILMTVVSVCFLAFLGTKITFDDNLKNFRSTSNEAFRLQDQVTRWLRGSTASVLLVTEGTSEEEVMEASSLIHATLEELVGSGKVAGVKSIGKYFPLPNQQKKNIEFLRQHADDFDIKRIKDKFDKALEENGFAVLKLYDDYFERLAKAFSVAQIVLPSSFNKTDLNRFLKPFVFRKGEHFKAVTYIHPSLDLWSSADTNAFKAMILEKLKTTGIPEDRYLLTGTNILTGDLKQLIIYNMESALWLAGFGIVLVLLIYYRSLKFFLLSILPLIIGLATLFGIMTIFGLNFNFLNLMVLPMIVGIGIDDGVHFTNSYRQLDHSGVFEALSLTGRAVVLTSLTTIVGFGSISLSHYPGLRSMGYVAVIGISSCLFASIIVLPSVFSILMRRK
jgi:predicted RND superfamily exporter protein